MNDQTTVKTFIRLLRTFTKPYATQLCIGILAGIFAGASILGIFAVLPVAVRVMQGETSVQEVLKGKSANAFVAPEKKAEKNTDSPGETENDDYPAMLKPMLSLAEKYGIPLENEEGKVSIQLGVSIAVFIFLCFAFQGIGHFINRYLLRWVGIRIVADLRDALFSSLHNQSLAFYGKRDIGQLISRCTNDTTIIEGAVANTVSDLCRAPVEIAVALGFIISVAVDKGLGRSLLLLVFLFPLGILPVFFLSRKLKFYSRKALGRISVLVSRMQETFSGIRVVKAFGMEQSEIKRFHDENRRYYKTVLRALLPELFMAPAMQLVAIGIACILLIVTILDGVELSILVTVAFAATRIYTPIKKLAKINVSLQRAAAASDRIFEYLDMDTKLIEAENPIPLEEFKNEIRFQNVNFFYDKDGSKILQDIDITIKKGSVIAFVGTTGSGKTTIANLLARFYDPTSGVITIDGEDLRNLETKSLRQIIGIVTQDTVLFNDTIAANISYGSPNATPDEIEKAAKQANAHDFIIAEEEGYERICGEKGFVLSGGQKQRIAIARAILKNPPILILDEATSALDTATELQVQEAINHVMEERTVFAIAHRLSTIKHADQICVLDAGKIIERGTHDELYAANGRYRELCDMQFS